MKALLIIDNEICEERKIENLSELGELNKDAFDATDGNAGWILANESEVSPDAENSTPTPAPSEAD